VNRVASWYIMKIESIGNSLDLLLKAAMEFYKDRLASFVVFGSYARNTANENSDLDILLVVEDLPNGRFARVDEWIQIEKIWSEKVFLSPVFFTPDELKQGSPLLLDMTQGEAILLYDKNNSLAEYLENLKSRLEKIGARKISKGKSSYWIMGPKTGREVVL